MYYMQLTLVTFSAKTLACVPRVALLL